MGVPRLAKPRAAFVRPCSCFGMYRRAVLEAWEGVPGGLDREKQACVMWGEGCRVEKERAVSILLAGCPVESIPSGSSALTWSFSSAGEGQTASSQPGGPRLNSLSYQISVNV